MKKLVVSVSLFVACLMLFACANQEVQDKQINLNEVLNINIEDVYYQEDYSDLYDKLFQDLNNRTYERIEQAEFDSYSFITFEDKNGNVLVYLALPLDESDVFGTSNNSEDYDKPENIRWYKSDGVNGVLIAFSNELAQQKVKGYLDSYESN